jgi:hypothetical protein
MRQVALITVSCLHNLHHLPRLHHDQDQPKLVPLHAVAAGQADHRADHLRHNHRSWGVQHVSTLSQVEGGISYSHTSSVKLD